MKTTINILLGAALALGVASCSKESPFEAGEQGNGYGRVLTSSLAVELRDSQTRAGVDSPDVAEFTVDFFRTTDLVSPVESYKYSEMPEIVTLPAGVDYKVVAHYGENPAAEWDAPYFLGESSVFSVKIDEIVDNLDPITCRLSNVKVSIFFDEALAAVMDSDSQVTVNVGGSSLMFKKDTEKSGYFAYVEGSTTLAATFRGTVDGDATNETKTYNDVRPGTHYSITFRLHTPNASGTGGSTLGSGDNSGFNVEAGVTIDDIGGEGGIDIDPGDEIILDDESERPSEGKDPNNPDNPDDPNNPVNPPVSGEGPVIVAQAPINLDDWNEVDASSVVVLNITSETGITNFVVEVISDTLDLSEVGLVNPLNLVTPGESLEGLQGLGLLKENQESLGGEKSVVFDISGFMGLLSPMFIGDHIFKVTVTDDSGETVKELKLRVK